MRRPEKGAVGTQSHSIPVTRVGRLESLNGHGELSGALWEPGSHVTCRFREEHRALLSCAWMQMVRVTGRMGRGREAELVLHVESLDIVPRDTEGEVAGRPSGSFWSPVSLEELAREQGVGPVEDLNEISRLWPADDDADEFLEFVLRQRRESRDLEGGSSR